MKSLILKKKKYTPLVEVNLKPLFVVQISTQPFFHLSFSILHCRILRILSLSYNLLYQCIVLLSFNCYLEYIISIKMIFVLPFAHFPIPRSRVIVHLNAVTIPLVIIREKYEEKILNWYLLQNHVN